ncbi:MAG: carboxypeptidase, partial [Flavipsychrobacter sp.]|nr:carboxypeptidase [Flavipsychrobacter sp.]
FYAAQFYHQAQQDINGLQQLVQNGEMNALLGWLREKVHVHGRKYNSEELCTRITGKGLDAAYFMQYIEDKYNGIYGLNN